MSDAKHDLASRAGTRRSRILVIDGDEQIRNTISEALSSKGCEVICDDSPYLLQARLSRSSLIDCFLIDVFHPAEKIFALIPVLKKTSPRAEVIFISRLDDVELWIEAIQRGAYDYLPKPLDRNELQRVVNNALEKNRTTQPSDKAQLS